jgi:hypothetical protein
MSEVMKQVAALEAELQRPPKPSGYVIDEGQRQAILLAIAKLANARAGWDPMLRELAAELSDPLAMSFKDGREGYDYFRKVDHDKLCPVDPQPGEENNAHLGAVIQWMHGTKSPVFTQMFYTDPEQRDLLGVVLIAMGQEGLQMLMRLKELNDTKQGS